MSSSSQTDSSTGGPGPWLILSLAIAGGATVANLYYAQPLIGQIGQSFGVDVSAAGLIVTMLQLGYVAGLFFIVPLGDLIENKRLILITLAGVIISLIAAATATAVWVFVAASLLLGLTATATQMIVPIAAHLAPEHRRGQVVGTVVSGLLMGILLARPLSTLFGGEFGWRAMYGFSGVVMCAALLIMAFALPRRNPRPGLTYGALIGSLWHLLLSTPVLQRRAIYQAFFFGAFTMFWTAVPLLLEAAPFSLGHVALSAVMLSGVIGAFVAPLAGRLADRGHGQAVTGISIALLAITFVLTWLGSSGSLALFVIAGITLDAGTQANLVVGQKAIYALPAEIRSRLNALYLAIFFLGGALGSALSGFAVTRGGGAAFSAIGLGFAMLAFAVFVTEFRAGRGNS
jgi:predicted MFS family arabinose efflux permease